MPRTYIRKKTPTYSIANLKLALDLIVDGERTVIDSRSICYLLIVLVVFQKLVFIILINVLSRKKNFFHQQLH
jgi:hypothetical protein